MADDPRHETIRALLVAAGNPAGLKENYATIKPTIDKALRWMDDGQIVQYLGTGRDFIDGATVIAQKVSGYEQAAEATAKSIKKASEAQASAGRTASAESKLRKQLGFVPAPVGPSSSFGFSTPQAAPAGGTADGGPAAGGKDPISLALGKAGYDHIEGNGPKALWQHLASGRIVSQEEALAEVAVAPPGASFLVWLQSQYGMSPQEAAVAASDPVLGPAYQAEFIQSGRVKAAASGFAPQAKSTGTLANGQPYIFDPNLPQGQQFYNGLTGAPLTPEEFKSVPKQITSPITGNLLLIDESGNVTDTGRKIGFAGIDPAVAAAEERRKFDVSESGLNTRSAADREAENRRALLSAQTAGFQTVAGLAPQLATAALDQAKFQKDVISSPADLAYRMFSTRGGTSPFPRVTQADIANQLADEIAKYNQTLQSYQPGPVGFNQPSQPPPVTGFSGSPTTFVGSEENPVSPAAGLAGFAAANPGFKMPQPPAEPAPITLNTQTGQWEQAGQVVGGFEQAAARVRQQAAPPPTTGPAQVAPIGFSSQVAAPSFQIPQIPVPPRVTQSELRALEQQSRPPAVASILRGETPRPLDLGFSLPTPQQYGSLTPDERKAFGSTLALQYDVSPEDYEFAVQKRFGRPQERPAARVVGF